MPTTVPSTQPLSDRCPRCRGRLRAERDRYGAYLSCLFCGYSHDLVSAAVIDLSDEEPVPAPTSLSA
jgi:hypothetical protein